MGLRVGLLGSEPGWWPPPNREIWRERRVRPPRVIARTRRTGRDRRREERIILEVLYG